MTPDARRALKKKALQVFEKVSSQDRVFVRYIGYDESEQELTEPVSSRPSPYDLGGALELFGSAAVFLGDYGPVVRIKGMVYDVTDIRIVRDDDDEDTDDEDEEDDDEQDNEQVGRDLMETVKPNEILAAIVGPNPLTAAELTQALWRYIKTNGLQDAKAKTQINADKKLKPLFGGKPSVSMFELTRVIQKNCTPVSSDQ